MPNRFNKAEIKKEETSLYIMETLKFFRPKLSQMERRVLLTRVDSIEELVASFGNIMGERVASMVFILSMRFCLQWLGIQTQAASYSNQCSIKWRSEHQVANITSTPTGSSLSHKNTMHLTPLARP